MQQDPNKPMEPNLETQTEEMRMGGGAGIGAVRENPGGPEDYTPPAEPEYKAEEKGETYIVEEGDTLSTIAARFYGSADEWERIYEANEDQVSDPDKIYPGQELAIPPQ